MMLRIRSAGAGVVAVLSLLIAWTVFAPAATAAESKSVQVVGQDGRNVEFRVYLDPTVEPTADSALTSSVVVSGVEVPSEVTAITEDAAPKEAILVLDVSGSMRGPRLAAAKGAAVNYVQALPDDVSIGLISFNRAPAVDVAPTRDKQAVVDAIRALEAGKSTALYDAMIQGIDLSDPDVGARLLVLTDGGDSASSATIEDVVAAADRESIPIDVVALTPNEKHSDLMRALASDTGGQYLLATDVTGLDSAFEEATGSFGGKVAVTAEFPQEVDASGKFAIVTVGVDGTDYTGTTQLPSTSELAGTGVPANTVPILPGDTAENQAAAAQRAQDPVAPWIYAALVALIIVITALAIASYRRQKRSRLRVQQVLWYSTAITTGEVGKRPELGDGGLLEGLDKWMSTQSWYPKIDTRLDNAQVKLNVSTWLAIRVVAMLVLAVVLGLLLGNVWLGILLGIIAGWFLSGMWLSSKEAARRKQFEEELPDFLLLMASSLRAGLSFLQALDSSAQEGQGEVSRQMRRAISENQMGSSIEDALLRVSDRMQNEDLKWTVTALTIQREVGGNLSNILENAANTVKSRFELRREVKTLSAEGRLSGWVLIGLPIGLFVYMLFANRAYVSFFWTNTVGIAMLVLIGFLFIAGFIWIRRIARIEV